MCGDNSACNLSFIQTYSSRPTKPKQAPYWSPGWLPRFELSARKHSLETGDFDGADDKSLVSRCLSIDTWPMRFRRIANLNSFTSTNCERPSACSLLLEKSKVGGLHYHHGGIR